MRPLINTILLIQCALGEMSQQYYVTIDHLLKLTGIKLIFYVEGNC